MPETPSSPLVALAWIVALLCLAAIRFQDPLQVTGVDTKGAADRPRPANARPAETGPVNLNTATASRLQTLPRIGPKLAARILESRRRAGNFKRVEDLARVKGIGPKLVERLRPLVVTSTTAAKPAPASKPDGGTQPTEH